MTKAYVVISDLGSTYVINHLYHTLEQAQAAVDSKTGEENIWTEHNGHEHIWTNHCQTYYIKELIDQ
jgi:hypothetical protein